MNLYIKIVDSNGNPDPVSSLADAIIERVRERGVRFRTETHITEDIRSAVHEMIRSGEVTVHNPVSVECHNCHNIATIWHTYPNGVNLCTNCRPIPEGD